MKAIILDTFCCGSVAKSEPCDLVAWRVHAGKPDEPIQGTPLPWRCDSDGGTGYLRYPLAYLQVAELLAERGLLVDASSIWRWVQAYSPELNKRCRPHLKTTNKSYRIDEAYIKIKAEDRYLYRAVDSMGQTIDFLLAAKRDADSAKRFFARFSGPTGIRWRAC